MSTSIIGFNSEVFLIGVIITIAVWATQLLRNMLERRNYLRFIIEVEFVLKGAGYKRDFNTSCSSRTNISWSYWQSLCLISSQYFIQTYSFNKNRLTLLSSYYQVSLSIPKRKPSQVYTTIITSNLIMKNRISQTNLLRRNFWKLQRNIFMRILKNIESTNIILV